jgi:hypothetical protein
VDKETHAKVAEEIENGNNSPFGSQNKQENGKGIEINASQTHIETPPPHPEVSQASQVSLDSDLPTDSCEKRVASDTKPGEPILPSYVHRIHPQSDMFRCGHCNYRDDKWGMGE